QGTIASAVEQQTATTNEITRHVTEAATGAGEIAAHVTGVSQVAQDTLSGAASAQAAAQDLARLAEELSLTVSRFVVEGSAPLRRMPAARGTDTDPRSGFEPSLAGAGQRMSGGNGMGTAG